MDSALRRLEQLVVDLRSSERRSAAAARDAATREIAMDIAAYCRQLTTPAELGKGMGGGWDRFG